ncbi:GATA-domain-containing protein [Hesseltinella vesiculosa]|uniref:GATA-domain-containing protein n=1 Tax=Hesseltinella vesiculosa TaxID=101127 RepID=A0A1X2GV14_9FUNG|nr:GATA-domain-containing protein [Hesseltinella vesiculosa]
MMNDPYYILNEDLSSFSEISMEQRQQPSRTTQPPAQLYSVPSESFLMTGMNSERPAPLDCSFQSQYTPPFYPQTSHPPAQHPSPPRSTSRKDLSQPPDLFYYYLLTHQSVIQKCSDNFFLLTGYTPLELLGRSLTAFLQHPPQPSSDVIHFYKKNGMTLPLTCKQSDYWSKNTLYVGCFKGSSLQSPAPPAASAYTMDYSSAHLSTSMVSPSNPHTAINPKRKHVKDMLHQYVCMDCGTTTSPEWRRGPHGPKTLCNACGLRWSKKNKKKDFNGN